MNILKCTSTTWYQAPVIIQTTKKPTMGKGKERESTETIPKTTTAQAPLTSLSEDHTSIL